MGRTGDPRSNNLSTAQLGGNYFTGCSHILAAFRAVNKFRLADHVEIIREVMAELKTCNAAKNESILDDLALKMSCHNRRTILQDKETGQWLSVLPSTVNNMELSPQEFRDASFLRYARCPPDLPSHCDGCGAKFDVRHALECKVGGLVIL